MASRRPPANKRVTPKNPRTPADKRVTPTDSHTLTDERVAAPDPRTLTLRERKAVIKDRFVSDIGFDPALIHRLTPDAQSAVRLVRADDLVVLEVEWTRLTIKHTADGPELEPASNRPGTLIVYFPPQNLAEEAFFESATEGNNNFPLPMADPEFNLFFPKPSASLGPIPVKHLLAEPSRLVFKVPSNTPPIPLNVAGILLACGNLELNVAPTAAVDPNARFDVLLLNDQVVNFGVVDGLASASATHRLILASRARRLINSDPRVQLADSSSMTGLDRGSASGLVSAITTAVDLGPVITAIKPKPTLPQKTHTAIESPYRLIISPNHLAGWAHDAEPVTRNGKTELWHTRLGIRNANGNGAAVAEGPHRQKRVRAIWTRDTESGWFGPDAPPAMPAPPFSAEIPFRMSLEERDRHNIVHLTSNFTLTEGDSDRPYVPRSVAVNNLMLSSLGSWMDTNGEWALDDLPQGLSVINWRHRATVGRDHYVRVVYAGFLFPFGHTASLIKITERKFHNGLPGNPAYLRQRMYIVIKEPVKTYPTTSLVYDGNDTGRIGESFHRKMPFRTLEVTTLVTPNLDSPDASAIANLGAAGFWPMVGGLPFEFHFVATDIAGGKQDFTIPAVFVEKGVTDLDASGDHDPSAPTAASSTHRIADAYNVDSRRQTDLKGQSVSYAPLSAPNSTTFTTQTVSFGAEIPHKGTTYNGLPTAQPRFYPSVTQADVQVDAVKAIARKNAPIQMAYHNIYLRHGFPSASSTENKGEVLFKVVSTSGNEVDFSSQGDRSGALVQPNMSLAAYSRRVGPVAGNEDSVNDIIGDGFNPVNFFSGMDAKLFGVVNLWDIIELAGVDDLIEDQMPRFVSQTLNVVERFLSDLDRVRAVLPAGNALNTAVQAYQDAIQDLITGSGSAAAVLGTMTSIIAELGAIVASPPALNAGALRVLNQQINDLLSMTASIDEDALSAFATGLELVQSQTASFEWRPKIKAWPSGSDAIFFPNLTDGGFVIAVVAAAGTKGDEARFSVTASIEDFDLNLIGPVRFLVLHFELLQFRVDAGKKPEIEVKFKERTGGHPGAIEFDGVLKFVETLRELIPFDGFSDPPNVTVSAEGIKAGFSLGLPNVAVGVFSLSNLSLGASFNVPFVGDPLSVTFNFCERENPAVLTVSLFGGGFFFGVTINPDGLQIFEAAIEFGAAISVDFGVASGGISVMAGVYFKMEDDGNQLNATLSGYFRLRGEVDVLGLISASIELYLELSYEFSTDKCIGRASLEIEVDVLLFSGTVTIETEKKFAGANGDPTFAQLMSVDPVTLQSQPWNDYCGAFV